MVRILLCSLFSSIFIAPASNAASDTTLLTICTSLKTDRQYISASGKCNERIYEKSTWYEPGMAPRGTLGSKTVSITLCTNKSRSNLRTLAKEGRSCNPAYQTQSIFQRPLGPPAAPELISVIADTLGTAIITKKAPLEDGGARIRSYEVIEVGSTTPANKVLATSTTSFPIKAQQSTKISGLTPSQSYRFAIRAINAIGASPLAQSSSVFVAPTLPGAPSITSAVANSFNSAQITYSPALSDGGSPITSYTITALPGRLQSTFFATDTKHHTFTGLSALTNYTFTIQATNIAGSGLASAPSNQITTFAPPPPPEPVAPTPSPSPSSSAPALAAPAFTLSSSSETRTVNTAATGFTISSTGGAIASFAISATPAGMSFSTSTGALTGTPTTVASATAYTVTATNATGSTTQTFTLTVSPGAATKAMMTTQPAGAVNGSAFTTQPVVRVTDSGDNTVTSFTGNVVASIASGTGTLSGTTVAAVAGVATFTNLVITGTAGNFTLTFTPASLTAVTSSSFALAAGAATKAMMTTQPAGAVNGSAFTTQPVVRVTDSGGNTVTTSTAVVTVSKASGSGTLSGTTTATAVAGVATFTNLVITGTGDHVLTFTPATLTAVNSETLTVSLATQATLSITSLTTSTKAYPYSQALSITTSGGSGTGATTFAIASGGTATGCALSNSTATATITATTVGTCLIQATKAADATYASTTSATATFTFTKATQTITFTDPADITFGASPVSLSATSTSTLSVAFTTATSGVCTVSGTTVTIVSAGTCTINANQAGNADYEAASQVSQSFTITKATPSLSSFADVSKTVGNPAFNLSAPTVANSLSGSFTYTSATTATATISGTTITLGSAGTTLITATFTPTDTANYNNATINMTLTLSVAAPAFTLSSSSETRTVNTAATGFTISSTGGAITSFAISATPAGMSFSTSTGALSGTPTTVAGATAYTVTATNATGSTTQTFTLTVSPGAATKVAITRASVGTTDNVAFTTQPQITIQDASGNTVSSSAVVTATISAGSLIGTTTATAVAGVATFTNLGIDGTPGTTYTITYTASGLTVATAAVTVALTCAAGGTCIVGDTGPGGGKVFYVAASNFTSTGSTCNTTCRYLEAAPTSGTSAWTNATYEWWSGTTAQAIGATARGTAIGTGYANTLAIVGQNSPAYRDATKARAYRGPNNLSDWHLPSKDELNQLYSNQATVGGFVVNYYWSSSEFDAGSAWAQYFGNGYQNQYRGKLNPDYVRPVRAF